MAFIVPYTFTGGKSAKAQEVNANFVAIQNEIDTIEGNLSNKTYITGVISGVYANLDGDATQLFNVATPTQDANATTKAYVDALVAPFKGLVSGLLITKVGNTTISVGSGGCYNETLIYPMQLTSNLTLDLSELGLTASATYNVYAISDTNNTLTSNAITSLQVTNTTPTTGTTTIYKLIGTVTLDSSGNIESVTSRGV